MCCLDGCKKSWTALQILWSLVYIVCGAAQLICGIYFFITLPELHLDCNLWTGGWNVIIGLCGGMLACFGRFTQRRQKCILYMAISILIANCINIVICEMGLYFLDLPVILKNHPYQDVFDYACFIIRITTCFVIIVSFLDSQFSFCSMQIEPKRDKKLNGSHEQVSDIEYIIPRQKSAKKSHINAYSQSWVFDPSNNSETPYLKILEQNGTTMQSPTTVKESTIKSNNCKIIDNPVVHIEECTNDDSDSQNDRKLGYMRSFSRSTSPVILSACSSNTNLSKQQNSEIYECLEKLTEPEIYRSRLNTAKEGDYHQPQAAVMMRRLESPPQTEKVQYASLMKELQRAIVSKKEPASQEGSSGGSKNSSRQDSEYNKTTNSSDTEFSKELEAALQLIHDLESPNTPSEQQKTDVERPLSVWKSDDDEKTLSGTSLNEITDLTVIGKSAISSVVVHHFPDSQSTSGYSSPTCSSSSNGPTTPNCWSTTSSLNGTNSKSLSYSIKRAESATVISLYAPPSNHNHPPSFKGKSITLVNITANQQHTDSIIGDLPVKHKPSEQIWNVKSLLRRKRSLPKLCPELEGAIIKSESLAYLSKIELLARLQRNKQIQREIEEKVIQRLGRTNLSDTESNC